MKFAASGCIGPDFAPTAVASTTSVSGLRALPGAREAPRPRRRTGRLVDFAGNTYRLRAFNPFGRGDAYLNPRCAGFGSRFFGHGSRRVSWRLGTGGTPGQMRD